MNESPFQPIDQDVHLWRLSDVADAAREVPLEAQPPRLQQALARLVQVPPSGEPAMPGDPRQPC